MIFVERRFDGFFLWMAVFALEVFVLLLLFEL